MKIAVINQKGGSGKTSLTVLISLALGSTGKRVLSIDCDSQGGLTSFLAPSFDERAGIYDILMGNDNYNILNVRRDTITFDLIPADHRLDKIYSSVNHYQFKNKFDDLEYDHIIFDTPPTAQGISLATSMIADKVYIPADVSRATLKPTLYTIEILKGIEKTGKVILIG